MVVHGGSDPQAGAPPTAQREHELPMPPTRAFIAPPPQGGAAPARSSASFASTLPVCAWVCVIFIALLWLLGVLSSARPVYHIFFTFVSLVPTLMAASFVLNRFNDDAVSKSFLVSQFLLSALPLTFVILCVQLLLLGVFGALLFSSDVDKFRELVLSGDQLSRLALDALSRAANAPFVSLDKRADASEGADNAFESLIRQIALWKWLLLAAFMSLIVAGVTEEVGKWTLARRYKQVNSLPHNVQWERRIGCRGILSVACMGALGFATFENYWSVVGLTASPGTTFQVAFVALALFRGLLAIPVHVCAQFYVAVSAAQWYIFHDAISVTASLCVAVLFHSVFDAISMVAMALTSARVAPRWLGVCAPVLQVGITGALVLLCRARYTALLERERLVLRSADVV